MSSFYNLDKNGEACIPFKANHKYSIIVYYKHNIKTVTLQYNAKYNNLIININPEQNDIESIEFGNIFLLPNPLIY